MTDDIINILLVEDDDVDAEAVRRAFDENDLPNPIRRAENGLEALEILRGTGTIAPMERPFLVLLDLNMPKMNGIEFLHELRCDESLAESVVFVLTTSNDDRDKWATYREHIAGYLIKSNVGEEFDELISLLTSFWSVVEPPPVRDADDRILCLQLGEEVL